MIDVGPVYYTTRRATLDIDEMDITYVYNAARWFVRKWKRPDLLPIIDSVHSGHARTILKWCILKQEDSRKWETPKINYAALSKEDVELLDKHHHLWDWDEEQWDDFVREPETNPQFTKLEEQYWYSRFLSKFYYPEYKQPQRKRHCLT